MMEDCVWQRGKEMKELKRLLLDYRVLEARQILPYFYGKEERSIQNMISLLLRDGQLVVDQTHRYISLNKTELVNGLEPELISSFWVLLYFAPHIRYHTKAQFPAQIYFWADGLEYEILYAKPGDEGLINSIYSRQTTNQCRQLVVVEQPKQIEMLNIPDAEWFCTVANNGKIHRYIQED